MTSNVPEDDATVDSNNKNTEDVNKSGGSRLKLTGFNAYLRCIICRGYLINATTLTECLHSFCKTCIVRYLATSKTCPICDSQVHKTKPLQNIRSDKTLQDIVYKIVPGLYKSEMKRRRQFYAKHPDSGGTSSEERGEIEDRIIYSADEKISLSLEFYTPQMAEHYYKRLFQYRHLVIPGENGSTHSEMSQPVACRRYLCCPAAVTVRHLLKFIKIKFSLSTNHKVEIIYCGEVLKQDWTLMDVAYIYTWRRNGPIRFFFQIISETIQKPRIPVNKAKEIVNDAVKDDEIVKEKDKDEKDVEKCEEEKVEKEDLSKPVTIEKPAIPPIKITPILPKPSNSEQITTTYHHKSEGSKTIAELINERKLKQKKQVRLIAPAVEVKKPDWPNQLNKNPKLPIIRPRIPVLHCVGSSNVPNNKFTVNGRSENAIVPIAPKPPASNINNVIEKNGFRPKSNEINGVHRAIATGQPTLPNLKIKINKKRKGEPNEEAVTTKIAKITNETEEVQVSATVSNGLKTVKSPLISTNGAVDHVKEIQKVVCDQNSNINAVQMSNVELEIINEEKSSKKVAEEMDVDAGKVNDDSLPLPSLEVTLISPSQNSDDKNLRDSPPPNSLVIVTSPEEAAISPQSSQTPPGNCKKDEKTKEKSRKQKSLDEVVKNLSMFGKESKSPDDQQAVNVNNNDGGEKKQKTRSPFFSPLDLSRKHLNLPVIPAPLPPSAICATSRIGPSATTTAKTNNNINKLLPVSANILKTVKNCQNGKQQGPIMNNNNNNNPTSPGAISASSSTNGCSKILSNQANHQNFASVDGGLKSPDKVKKQINSANLNKSPSIVTPSIAMAAASATVTTLPNSMPSPPVSLPAFLPNPHIRYNRYQLEMLSKFGSQLLNTAMFYNNMTRPGRGRRGGKPTKKL